MDHQDKSWAPHNACKASVKNLCQWTRGARIELSFGIPMVWQEKKNHVDDCYFCLKKPSGYRKKTWQKLSYPNLDSAIRSVLLSHEIPVPVFTELPSLEDEDMIYVNQMKIMDKPVIQTLWIYQPKNVKASTRQNSMI